MCSYAFDVDKTSQAFTNRRVFTYVDTGIPDGIQVDKAGNVYASCGDGVQVRKAIYKRRTTLTTFLRYGTLKALCWVNSSWDLRRPIWCSLGLGGLLSWQKLEYTWQKLPLWDLIWSSRSHLALRVSIRCDA